MMTYESNCTLPSELLTQIANEGLGCLPEMIRTTNGLERWNKEIKQRTRIVGIFPKQAACLRLVTALAMECLDEWETGKVYISLTSSL